jgi:hypothetical protein
MDTNLKDLLLKFAQIEQSNNDYERIKLENELNVPRTDIPYYPAKTGYSNDSGAYYGGDTKEGPERLEKFTRLYDLLNRK